jgi:hypothetical protein
LEIDVSLPEISKVIYSTAINTAPPFGPIKVTVVQSDAQFNFSVRGIYEVDLLKLFQEYDFPIYKRLSDDTIKIMNRK